MHRSSRYLFFSVAGILFAPLATHAATTSFFGPIIPTACNCAAEWGCVLQSFQNLMNVAIALGTVLITLYIAWAGVAYLMAPINAEGRQAGKTRLMNAVLGLLIMLGAWLLIDSIMKVIYAGNSNTNPAGFLPWNNILQGSGDCITATTPSASLPTPGAAPNASGGAVQPSTGGVGKGGTAQCAAGNTACSVQTLEADGLSQNQAQAMSCIAMSESSGNPNTPDSPTYACGTFQITTNPGNWSNPAFHSGSCSVNTSCNDATCNTQTAILMLDTQGYQPWTGINSKTGQPWNPTAVQCVNNFDPGN